MLLRVVCKNHRPCWRGLGSVAIGCVLFLGLIARLGSAVKPVQRHPVPGLCRSIIRKVESFTESKLQSSLVNVRGGICTWLQLNGCQQYKVVFTPIYRRSFRTVYVHGFTCCAGYRREGNSCVPEGIVTDSPGPTQDVPEGVIPTKGNSPGSSPGFTGVVGTVGPDTATQSFNVPPRIPSYPDSGRTPQPDQEPPHGLVDTKLLIILLVLIALVVLFAVASYAAHFAKHVQRGRPVCRAGRLRAPKLHNEEDIMDEEPSKLNCTLSTISKDCSDDSFISERSHRSGSDQSGQSGLSGSSGVTFIDDDDSGIVKHVVYEKCWKDTTSLISNTSSSSSSRKGTKESGQRVSTSAHKKCTPLQNLPQGPKNRRPSPPIPSLRDVKHDQTPRSPNLTLPPSQPKYSSPVVRQQRSPIPYSYTSLEKSRHRKKSSPMNIISPHNDTEALIPGEPDDDVTVGDAPVQKRCPTYVNVELDSKRKNTRPVYVTLEPDADSVALGTECCEDDDDPWMMSHSPASSSIGSSVGYCSLSNQVLPHRVSGNGYDKLERNRQNFPVVAENCPPEYAVPSVAASTSCLTVEDESSYNRLSRGSPDPCRSSGTLPSITFAYLKLADEGVAEIKQAEEVEVEEERYIRTPRHNHKELVFIDAPKTFKPKTQTSKCLSLG